MAPSAVAEHSEWTSPSVPGTAGIDFEDVAASGDTVVAVGAASTAGSSDAPAIRRRPAAGAAWIADTVAGLPGDGTDFELVDVAIAGTATGWAVGTYKDASAVEQPLVLRMTGGTLAGSSAATWSVVAPATGMGLPRAVALEAPGSSSAGLIGADDGKVYKVDDGAGAVGAASGDPATAPAAAINAIALGGGDFAVGEHPEPPAETDKQPRIYAASAGGPSLSPVGAVSTAPAHFDAVAAAGATRAIALEQKLTGAKPRYWEPDTATGIWQKQPEGPFIEEDTLRDVSMLSTSSSSALTALAGDKAGAGAVWRRAPGSSSWESHLSLSTAPLNGVAVVSESEIVAVGDGGTVKRFAPASHPNTGGGGGGGGETPTPPETAITSGPVGTVDDESPTFTFVSQPAGASFECSLDGAAFTSCSSPHTVGPLEAGEHVFKVRAVNADGADPSPAVRQFGIVETEVTEPGGNCTRPKLKGENVTGIKVTNRPMKRSKRKRLARKADRLERRAKRKWRRARRDGKATRADRAKHRRLERRATRTRRKARSRGKLVVRFKLRRTSRVRALALRKGRVVGKTKRKTLKRGRHTVRVRYRKAPDTVRIKAKLAKRCKNKSSNR